MVRDPARRAARAPALPAVLAPLDFHSGNGRETSYSAARERFEALLRDAVRSHTVADFRVGALLSGGLDSSTIAALLAAKAGASSRPSLSERDGDRRLCELPYAEAVARAHGLVNHQAASTRTGPAPRAAAIRALEEPPLAPAALAQYRTFQLCAEHGVTVVLDWPGRRRGPGGYPTTSAAAGGTACGRAAARDARRDGAIGGAKA